MNKLTQEQSVEFAKSLVEKEKRSPITLVDVNSDFSFATDEEVKATAAIIKHDFQETITELADR